MRKSLLKPERGAHLYHGAPNESEAFVKIRLRLLYVWVKNNTKLHVI